MTELILVISLWGFILFNPKRFYYSYAWSCSLCERRTSFCTGLISRKLCRFLCFRLALLHSVSYFFFLYRSPSSSLCTVFCSILSNIDLLMCLSLETSIIKTGWPILVELIDLRNIFIIFLSQTTLLRYLTFQPSMTVTVTVLLFWISLNGFPSIGNSDLVVVTVSIDFPITQNRMPRFIALLTTILVLIGMVFWIIWEMFHETISVNF